MSFAKPDFDKTGGHRRLRRFDGVTVRLRALSNPRFNTLHGV